MDNPMPEPLNWHPNYAHSHTKKPPKTTLTTYSAVPVYAKLRNYLGIQTQAQCPAGGWTRAGQRHLFHMNGWHYGVEWMPTLEQGWRRLTFQEFCAWYAIPTTPRGAPDE